MNGHNAVVWKKLGYGGRVELLGAPETLFVEPQGDSESALKFGRAAYNRGYEAGAGSSGGVLRLTKEELKKANVKIAELEISLMSARDALSKAGLIK